MTKKLRSFKLILSILVLLMYLLNSCQPISALESDAGNDYETGEIMEDGSVYIDLADAVYNDETGIYEITFPTFYATFEVFNLGLQYQPVNSLSTRLYAINNLSMNKEYFINDTSVTNNSYFRSMDLSLGLDSESWLEPDVEYTVEVSFTMELSYASGPDILQDVGSIAGLGAYSAQTNFYAFDLVGTASSNSTYRGKLTNDSGSRLNRINCNFPNINWLFQGSWFKFVLTDVYVDEKPLSSVVDDGLDEVNNQLSGIWGAISGLGSLIQNIVDGLLNLPNLIAEALSGFFQMIVDGLNSLGEQLVKNITNLGNFLSDCLDSLGSAITGAIDTLLNTLSGLLNSIIQGIIDLGNFIIEGLKDLFIPDDGFFSDYFQSLYDFFDEKLGILLYPFELIVTIGNKFLSISEGDGIIHIPDITINSWHIIDAYDFNIKNVVSIALGSTYYNLYFAFVDVILIVLFINFCIKKYQEIIQKNNLTGGL